MQIFLNISILPSAFFDVRVPMHACMMTGEMQISLGLTRFQFALALLLPSSHTRLGLCGRSYLRSQIEQTNQIYFFGQPYSEADRAL